MENILVAIDDCENTSIASPIMVKTLEIARNVMGKVWVVHVVPDTNRPPPFNIDRIVLRREVAAELSNEHSYLQQLAHCLRQRNIDAMALLLEGATIKTILEEAFRLEIDLFVLRCQAHGLFYCALIKITDDALLRECTCPILFVPESRQ